MFTISFFKEMYIIITLYLITKVFNKTIIFDTLALAEVDIWIINIAINVKIINIYINYSKAFSGVIIIIFIKSFKFKFSIFNKFKGSLILNL